MYDYSNNYDATTRTINTNTIINFNITNNNTTHENNNTIHLCLSVYPNIK